MTQPVERAFAVASLLLAELDSDHRWAEAFATTQDELSALADEALHEFEAGETQPLDLARDFPNHQTVSEASF